MTHFSESVVEDATLGWLESLGFAVLHLPAPQSESTRQAGGPDIAAGELRVSDAETVAEATA